VRGSASDVADRIEEWFRSEAADGFILLPHTMPGAVEDFVHLVVPELQRRGLFRTEYAGRTLRQHLGLARPENRFHAAAAVAE
ncbi:MAG: LLM class flavin-dependent oxidoreductase, partial [Stellaceae bacterium]